MHSKKDFQHPFCWFGKEPFLPPAVYWPKKFSKAFLSKFLGIWEFPKIGQYTFNGEYERLFYLAVYKKLPHITGDLQLLECQTSHPMPLATFPLPSSDIDFTARKDKCIWNEIAIPRLTLMDFFWWLTVAEALASATHFQIEGRRFHRKVLWLPSLVTQVALWLVEPPLVIWFSPTLQSVVQVSERVVSKVHKCNFSILYNFSSFLHLCLIVFRDFMLVGSRICVCLLWSSVRDVTSKALTAFYFATGTGPNWNMLKCQTLQPSVHMVRNTKYWESLWPIAFS